MTAAIPVLQLLFDAVFLIGLASLLTSAAIVGWALWDYWVRGPRERDRGRADVRERAPVRVLQGGRRR